jgi:hypothetical protein
MENKMTRSSLVTAALIAVAALTVPAVARETQVVRRHAAAEARVAPAGYVDGRACVPAPRVGAFATQPWDQGATPCEPVRSY